MSNLGTLLTSCIDMELVPKFTNVYSYIFILVDILINI